MRATVSANARDPVWRRKELLGAGIAFVVAVSLAVGIMPWRPWIMALGLFPIPTSSLVIANLLVGATLLAVPALTRRFVGLTRGLAALAGLLAFVAGAIVVFEMSLPWTRVVIGAADVVASGLALAVSTGAAGFLRHVWQDMGTHRRVVLLLLGLWIALSALGVTLQRLVDAGWFEDSGWSETVWNLSVTGLYLLPLPGSFLVGWWRNRPAARPEEGCIGQSLLGGGLLMLVNILVWSALSVISELASGAFVFGWEGVAFISLFAAIGFVLGAVAALIGVGLAAIWCQWHDRGGPAAHAGTP